MRSRMSECSFSFFIVKCQDTELAVMIDHRPQIDDFSVNLTGCSNSGKPFTDINSDLIHALWFLILFE